MTGPFGLVQGLHGCGVPVWSQLRTSHFGERLTDEGGDPWVPCATIVDDPEWDATLSMGNGHSACANRIRRAARAYIITEELQRSGQRGSTGDSMEHTHGATGSEEKQGWSGRGRIGHGTASSVGGSGCTEMSRGGPGGMVHESCHRRGRHGSGLPRGQGLGWAQRVVGCRRVRLDAGPVWDIAKDHVLGHKGEEGPGEQSFEIEGD